MKVFLYVLAIMIPPIATILADHFLFVKENKAGIIVKNCFKIFFLINLINLSWFYNVWHFKSILNPFKQEYLYFLYFFLQGILIGGIYLLIRYIKTKYFIKDEKQLKHKGGIYTLYGFSIFLFGFGVLEFAGTMWERTIYYGSYPDQIIITMFTPIVGTDPKIIMSFIEGPALLSITSGFIFALIFFDRVNYKITYKGNAVTVINETISRIVDVCLSCTMMFSGLGFMIWGLQIDKVLISYTKESPFIQENYVDPGEAEIIVPSKKRNLIHIYLESIENSYFDKANDGIMEENLMPNLLNLYEEGHNFSHLSNGYGGPLKTYGGSFSCGSMVNQFFGLPMKVPSVAGQYSVKGKFLPGAVGIGDIFETLGYNQTMMLGADADFGGLTNMFKDHGNFKIMDYKYALKNGMIPIDYNVNWGFEDGKLYEFAKEEITRLSKQDKPFHFLMENADTHNPGFSFDGERPVFGESNLPNDYGKTIKFSEKNVYKFIKWIQEQPFYLDGSTTIVVIGDHNSMDGSLFRNKDMGDFIRTTYNLILHPVEELNNVDVNRFHERQWANFDMMPTILTALGYKIKGDRLGIGTNLYSNLPTVYEKYGYEKITNDLICKSNFYNTKFVKGKINYDGSNLKFVN